jgi:hypothetical protein
VFTCNSDWREVLWGPDDWNRKEGPGATLPQLLPYSTCLHEVVCERLALMPSPTLPYKSVESPCGRVMPRLDEFDAASKGKMKKN